MADFSLQVISPPTKPKPYRISGKEVTPFHSEGPDNLLCGECSFVLASNITKGQICKLSLECPVCGALNSIE